MNLPPLPELPDNEVIPLSAIRYVPGYTKSFVQEYATAYARAALAAQPGSVAWHPTEKERADGDRGIRWVSQGKIFGRPSEHDVREYLIRSARVGECACPECRAFYAAAPTEAKPAQQDAVDAERAIAGALFDFLGFLTTSERQWTFSSYDEAGSAVEALEHWAEKRNLSLNEADVSGWSAALGSKGGQR